MKLKNSSVAVLGLGGVGASCAEALCRAGIGRLILADNDKFDASNLNRQLFATSSTLGQSKCAAAKERLKQINGEAEIITLESFYSENDRRVFDFGAGFIADAIDTVSAKLDLITTAKSKNIHIISCMGAGNRLDPTKFTIGDIFDTAGCGCGLARVMRRELKKMGVGELAVVYSREQPIIRAISGDGRHAPASISYCPPVAGLFMASYIINTIIGV